MATILEYLDDDAPKLAELESRDGKRLTVKDPLGQVRRITNERVLFEHPGGDLATLETRLEALTASVDVPLLWETARDEDKGDEVPVAELAGLYFDARDSHHCAAIFRALFRDRVRFRRRGTTFTARSPDEVTQLEHKLEAETRAAEELEMLKGLFRSSTPLNDALAARLLRWLRGAADKLLDRATADRSDAKRQICWRLIDENYLPKTTDPELLDADLDAEHPAPVVAHAEAIAQAPLPEATARAAFSIDDPETREVDDALSATREGDLIRVDIDIADVASLVTPDDPVDREARRRATTVYLPMETYYMLPHVLGCDHGSLTPDLPRGVLRTSIWFDAEGRIVRHALARLTARLERRLDYTHADRLLAPDDDIHANPASNEDTQEESPSALIAELHLLDEVACARRRYRAARGALMLQRPEWKLHVDPEGHVSAEAITMNSPSRRLVAELMIATNEVAATLAVNEELALIFRTQTRPEEPLPPIDPNDPGALFKLRGLLKPATLSLKAQEHWGLGLDAYTQITSPLRRYGDLVQQRQICAYLAGEAPPYDARQLLDILTDVERREREMRRLDAALTTRWALEHAAQGERRGRRARVTAKLKENYKAMLLDNGAEGLLNSRENLQVGQELLVDIEHVKPRRGALRMVLARS